MNVLKDSEFQNWVKACLVVKCVRDAMFPLVEKYCEEHYLKNTDHVVKVCGVVVYSCNMCDVTKLEPYHKISSVKCEYKRCACKEKDKRPCPQKRACGLMYDQIKAAHTKNDPRWSNTNCNKWSSNAWEQMKCYISSSGYKEKADIKCADLSALISICLNYLPLRMSFNQNDEDLDKVRSCRNEVFHSSTLKLENDELKQVYSTMTTFLKLKVFADFHAEVMPQIEYIRKLENGEISIGEKEEINARKYAMDGIRDTQAALSNTYHHHEEALEHQENLIKSEEVSNPLDTNIKDDLNKTLTSWVKTVRDFNKLMNNEYKDVLTHMEQLCQAKVEERVEIGKVNNSFSGIQTIIKPIRDNVLSAVEIAKRRMTNSEKIKAEKQIETMSRTIIELEFQVRLLEDEKQELDNAHHQPDSPHSKFVVPRILRQATPRNISLYARLRIINQQMMAEKEKKKNVGQLVSDRSCLEKLYGKLREFLLFIDRALSIVQDVKCPVFDMPIFQCVMVGLLQY